VARACRGCAARTRASSPDACVVRIHSPDSSAGRGRSTRSHGGRIRTRRGEHRPRPVDAPRSPAAAAATTPIPRRRNPPRAPVEEPAAVLLTRSRRRMRTLQLVSYAPPRPPRALPLCVSRLTHQRPPAFDRVPAPPPARPVTARSPGRIHGTRPRRRPSPGTAWQAVFGGRFGGKPEGRSRSSPGAPISRPAIS
jgi:hypothetical protein